MAASPRTPDVDGIFAEELLELLKEGSTKTNFSVKNVQITPKDLSDLSAVIRTSTTLRSISLCGTRLNNSTQLIDLFEAIKANKSIESLDFSDNSFGDDGVELIADVVQARHNIRTVVLTNCGISFEGCDRLRNMLTLNKKVEVLDVSENPQVMDDGVKLICQGLLDAPLGESTHIKKLFLGNVAMGDEACKIMGSVLASSSELEVLDLKDNNIRKNGVKFLCHGLAKKRSRSLKRLDLSENLIGDEGVGFVTKRIGVNSGVKELLLRDVGMKTESFKKLCSAVANSDFVEKLAVGSNPIDSDSVANVSIELLNNSSSLESLDLSKIKLSKEDVKSLGEFLGHRIRCRLRVLNLSGTGIDDEGAVYIAQGLMGNMGLEELDVTSNPFGPKGARSFAKTFRRAKNLKVFRVTGQSRILAEGENYLAECLKYNKTIEIRGASRELDYLTNFTKHGKAFEYDSRGRIVGWSEEAWEVVKRGCGQIIATVLYSMEKEEFKWFKQNVVKNSRNVVKQDMFEYVLRHAESPALDVVAAFVNKLGIALDDPCASKATAAMAKEYRKSDDATYRSVAKEHAKDPMVREMVKNNRLFLGRYLTENGPAIHETHEVVRFLGKDTLGVGKDKNKKIFVQIYEDDMDYLREVTARKDLKDQLNAAGPFALYDTLLKEIEFHEEQNCISFLSNITDLRHCVNNLGVTAGYNIHETMFLAKRAAQCLGTINNLGRIHGDFRPRNFVKVAAKRMGTDPVGRTGKKVQLPDKWVVFDLSKSMSHGDPALLRMNSAYLPPEVARVTFNKNFSEKQMPIANEKMDVWSFGVVLYQLLTGVPLFHAESNTDRIYKSEERLELMNWINLDESRQRLILHRAAESKFRNKTTFERIKNAAVDLVNWCLQGDPFNRPSFNDILSHPFFVYRTNVNYTEVDLLLGWYKKIGADMGLASHKNNRTHAHIVNAKSKECADVFTSIKLLYSKVGCKVTSDVEDWKLDIQKRREKVQKSRTLIILLEKGVFWRPSIMKKLLWAMDSIETQNLILLDISTAFTSAEKFDFDEYLAELESKEGQKKLDTLVKSLSPLKEKVDLKQIKFKNSKSWLKKYILDQVNEYIFSLKDKVVPYRTRDFQTQAMVNEMLKRSGFIAEPMLSAFNLFDLDKTLYTEVEEEKKQSAVKILILYNEETEKLRTDALSLRKELLKLESSATKPQISLIANPADIFKHFEMSTERSVSKSGKVSSTRILQAECQTLALCLVSEGFYEVFREQMLLLNNARGLVSVVPICYDSFNPSSGVAKEEVLNLGLENKSVLQKLQDEKSYIPLPKAKRNLQYESDAAMNFILKEAGKAIELTRANESKDENDVYTRYTKSNLFESVY